MTHSIVQADAVEFLRVQPEGSLDLVFGSPPYEQARLYLEGGINMGISRKTDAWVEWMVEVYTAAQRACRGLVAFVVAGQTRNYRWSVGPALLMAELHRAGLNLRNPPVFSRVGIPGSGGPDWLRSDYEWIVCTSRPGRLPWSDNTACGHPPKWAPGGEMSHRLTDGTRTSQWGKSGSPRGNAKGSCMFRVNERKKDGSRRITRGHANGDTPNSDSYDPPVLANPGNEIQQSYTFTARQLAEMLADPSDVQRHLVGGGTMGDPLCHKNEAPFPEALAEFFVRSFCPPDGTVCDCFSGSGTTAAMAKKHGRNFTGCDLRASQVQLGLKRLANVTPMMLAE